MSIENLLNWKVETEVNDWLVPEAYPGKVLGVNPPRRENFFNLLGFFETQTPLGAVLLLRNALQGGEGV